MDNYDNFMDWLWHIKLEKEITVIRKRRMLEAVPATEVELHDKIITEIENLKQNLKVRLYDDEAIVKEYQIMVHVIPSVEKMESADGN